MKVLGLVLAGGASSRMGEDKALVQLAGESLVARAVRRLSPQVDRVILSAKHNYDLDIDYVRDEQNGQGPVSGILAGLEYARAQGFASLLSVAVDTPFFPDDLGQQLAPGQYVARHYTCAHWKTEFEAQIAKAFIAGERRLAPILALCNMQAIDLPEEGFFNVNDAQDLAMAQARLLS